MSVTCTASSQVKPGFLAWLYGTSVIAATTVPHGTWLQEIAPLILTLHQTYFNLKQLLPHPSHWQLGSLWEEFVVVLEEGQDAELLDLFKEAGSTHFTNWLLQYQVDICSGKTNSMVCFFLANYPSPFYFCLNLIDSTSLTQGVFTFLKRGKYFSGQSFST